MAVIGVGQIGGSVALGARVAGAVTEVIAWSRKKYPELMVSVEILDKWYTDRHDHTYTTETGRLFKKPEKSSLRRSATGCASPMRSSCPSLPG